MMKAICEHIWDKWYPQSRTQQHRQCVRPGCNAYEIREAPKG